MEYSPTPLLPFVIRRSLYGRILARDAGEAVPVQGELGDPQRAKRRVTRQEFLKAREANEARIGELAEDSR